MGYQEEFFKKYYPYAKKAADSLDMPVSTVLAQWGWESTYGTSDVFKNNNNLAGIKFVGRDSQDWKSPSGYAGYKSVDRFVDDYIRTMNNGYYQAVKDAVSSEDTAYALGKSPWAESFYGGGTNLIGVIKSYNLKQYDDMLNPSSHPYGFDKDSILKAVNGLSESDKKLYTVVGASALAVFWIFQNFFND